MAGFGVLITFVSLLILCRGTGRNWSALAFRFASLLRPPKFIKTWGVKGDSTGQFDIPHTIVIDSNDQLYVGDRQNERIQVFNSEGDFLKALALPGHPWGLVMYANKLYVSIGTQGRIIEVSKEGKVTGTFGSPGKKPGQFDCLT